MSPSKKRKRSSPPPPPRRSARLRGQDATASSSSSSSRPTVPPPPHPRRGLSVLSTDAENSQTMPKLLSDALQRISTYSAQCLPHEDKLKPALEAFLEWLPDEGKVSVARDILATTTDEELHQVFFNLLTALAMPMKTRSHAGSVKSSPHPHRQAAEEAVASTLDEPLERENKFRDACLQRDDYCSVVSGFLDPDTYDERGRPQGVGSANLTVAHIVPFPYGSWNTATVQPHISTIWEALLRCFPDIRRIGLTPESINDVCNGMTMDVALHIPFSSFALALKSTDTPNVYQCMTFRGFATSDANYLPDNGVIVLKQAPGTEDLPLPSPVLLDCHYRLAEILNASGMGNVIDEHWRRWEELKATVQHTLRSDGDSDLGNLLRTALWHRVRT